MGELITTSNTALVNRLGNGELSTLIKPLKNTVHLFDTYIAGTSHLEDKTVLASVKAGDLLTLRREDNLHDAKAILVLTVSSDKKEAKLGYIPKKDNLIFSRLLDAGKALEAKVKLVKQEEHYTRIDIGIYLVDF